MHKNISVIQIENVNTPEAARVYLGKKMYFKRSDCTLPKGRYFISDILGFAVYDKATNAAYGTLQEVSNNGANDIFHIKDENGKIWLFPAVSEFLNEFDFEQNKVFISPIKGMFTDED